MLTASTRRFRPALALALVFAATAAGAQTATTVFDEDDADGAGYYAASEGGAEGGAALVLAGPDGDRLPVASGDAASGADYGVLEYAHGRGGPQTGGAWRLLVGAPGFAPVDLSGADSLVLSLNGPAGVPGVALPTVALVDADGRRTVGVALDFGTRVGFDRNGSGFLDGSPTDAALRVSYVESLPADAARPGYPEALRLTFADEAVATSVAAIGVPAVPARFTVETEGGVALPFRFRDTDGDGTLSGPDEYAEVLTPEAAGSDRLRPTWRITTSGTPAAPPGAGDVYRLAVFNSGVDSDPETWQRRAIAVSDFGPLGGLDLARIRGVVFENAEAPTARRVLWVDAVGGVAYDGDPDGPAPPSAITAETGDRTVLLRWTAPPGTFGVLVYRRDGPGEPFRLLTERPVGQDHYADLSAENGEAATYVLRAVRFGGVQGPDSEPVTATAGGAGDPYVDLTARLAFDYFWEQANPANGLVKDRSTDGSAASIAAVGFGLSAITVGIDRGWITRAEGAGRVEATLDFFATCPQGEAPSGTCGYRGFFYHFLTMQSGVRAGTNELSTIDTALLLGGVLQVAEYFDGEGEARIRELADTIWRRVEWDWATPRSPRVALGWRPEEGFLPFDWRGYNEAMILYVLGLGSPTHPLPADAWDAWTATYPSDWQTHYGFTFLTFPPLFGHQYSHVWIDFRGIQDEYMREKGSDYFENSRKATLAQRAYAIDNPRGWPNYGPNEWGLTASDDPPPAPLYIARGAAPVQNDNGTITPTAAGGSYAFTPAESREALRTFYARYRPTLWGPYGLRDAYNVALDWTATDYLGIDQGPIVLMIENERTGAVWDAFTRHPDVQRGLDRAGFQPRPTPTEGGVAAPALALAPPAPNPSARGVRLAFTTPAAGDVRLAVYDVLGREVAVVADGERPAGTHAAAWDASGAAAGVYVVRLEAGGVLRARTVTVVR